MMMPSKTLGYVCSNGTCSANKLILQSEYLIGSQAFCRLREGNTKLPRRFVALKILEGFENLRHQLNNHHLATGEVALHAQTFHGALPEAQCSSSCCFSRKVSIGCQ